MKKIISMLGTGLGLIVGVPILLVACILYLLYVPFDMIRYHKMPYYQNLKHKYEFFLTSSDVVKLYNRIAREQLPIEYFENEDFEYFVKGGQVLVCGWGYDGFEEINGEWFFLLDGECNTKMTMKETLENEADLFKPEHKCLPAKFLIFYENMEDAEEIEQAKNCPYFYCVPSINADI